MFTLRGKKCLALYFFSTGTVFLAYVYIIIKREQSRSIYRSVYENFYKEMLSRMRYIIVQFIRDYFNCCSIYFIQVENANIFDKGTS